MLREPASIALFCHLLLRHAPVGIEKIYIDSFTILSIAMGLQNAINYFSKIDERAKSSVTSIIGIHSYDIEKDFSFSQENEYVVLISASSSGDYAKKTS